MAWCGGVRKPEGGNAVLENVGEGEKSGFFREHAADSLLSEAFILDAVEFFDAFVVVLRSVSYVARAGSARPRCKKPNRCYFGGEGISTWSCVFASMTSSSSLRWRKFK